MKHVHSSDPRKKSIVAAILKVAGRGSKVTMLKEDPATGLFTGDVLEKKNGERGWKALGSFSASLPGVRGGKKPVVKTEKDIPAGVGTLSGRFTRGSQKDVNARLDAAKVKKPTKPVKKTSGESVRALAHRLILAGKLADAEIHKQMCKAAGKELPRSYVSWYRSELKRLGNKKVPAAKKVAK